MHSLTKSLRLSEVVYVLAEEANFLLRATILAIDFSNIPLLVISQDEVRSIARRRIRPGSLAPTRKALKVPSAPIAPYNVRDYYAGSLPIKDAQVLGENSKKKI